MAPRRPATYSASRCTRARAPPRSTARRRWRGGRQPRLTVTPEDGYRLARLTVNGLERTADENGRLALEGIFEDRTIEVTFEKADGNDALYFIMIAVIVLIFCRRGAFSIKNGGSRCGQQKRC